MKTCKECSKEFEPRTTKDIFCTPKCKQKNYRDRKRDEILEIKKHLQSMKSQKISDKPNWFNHEEHEMIKEFEDKKSNNLEKKVEAIFIGDNPYGFEVEKYFMVDKYTKHKPADAPKEAWKKNDWSAEKKKSDAIIHAAWIEFQKKNK